MKEILRDGRNYVDEEGDVRDLSDFVEDQIRSIEAEVERLDAERRLPITLEGVPNPPLAVDIEDHRIALNAIKAAHGRQNRAIGHRTRFNNDLSDRMKRATDRDMLAVNEVHIPTLMASDAYRENGADPVNVEHAEISMRYALRKEFGGKGPEATEKRRAS